MDSHELSDEQIERMIKLSYLRMIQNMATQSQAQPQTSSPAWTLVMDKLMNLENRVHRIEQERTAAIIRPQLDPRIFDAAMSASKSSDINSVLDAVMAAATGHTSLFSRPPPYSGTAGPGTPIDSIKESIGKVLRDFDKFLADYTDEVSKGDYKSKDAILTMLENVKLEYERIKRVHGLRMGGAAL